MIRTSLCLALLACSDPTGVEPDAVTTHASYTGIYVLGNSDLKNLDDIDLPYVDGYALRIAWTQIDTDGTNNFQPIIDALAQVSTAGKKLTIGLDAQLVPDDVLALAQQTYTTTVPGPGHTNYKALTSVTWDQPTLTAYTNMIQALANTQVCAVGSTCAHKIPLASHPALAGIRVNIIGIGKLRILGDESLTEFDLANYRRPTFIAAVLANIHAVQDRFPGVTTWVPYFSVDDSITTGRTDLDTVLIADLTTEFPGLGFFQELLKGDTPPQTSTNGINLLAAKAAGGITNFQACGGWLDQSLCTFSDGDTTPENGFDLAYGTYGTRYYELYDGDLVGGDPTMFATWDAFILDPDAPNPVGLTGRASTGGIALAWTDVSTIETSWIVERATTGDFAPLGDPLPPDQTTFTDATAKHGTFSYRVHAVGTAGPFVLSNVVTVTR